MTLNSIFQFLVPKDKTFYPLFEQAANKIKLLSETLNDAVKLPANDRDKLLKEVEVLKSEIEAIVQTTRLELERNFITPFDREDINNLMTAVDEVAEDRKSTRLNSSHVRISYAVFCLKKKNK